MSESRIHLLGNGLRPNQRKNLAAQNITVGEVMEALQSERAENENMVKWYMQQLPELVAKMVADALAANGLTLLPPNWVQQEQPSADNIPSDSEGAE